MSFITTSLGLMFGLFVAVASIFSLVPQLYAIIKKRSTVGLSFVSLLLGSLSAYSGMLNAFIKNLNSLATCRNIGFQSCSAAAIVCLQLSGMWFVYTAIVIAFVKYYSYKRNQTHWLVIRITTVLFGLFMLFAVGLALYLVLSFHPEETLPQIYGTFWGYFASILSFVQWSPQIAHTFVKRGRGNLSLLMVTIMAPGGVVVVMYMILANQQFSTWIAFAVSTAQLILLWVMMIGFRWVYWPMYRKTAFKDLLKDDVEGEKHDQEKQYLYDSNDNLNNNNNNNDDSLSSNNLNDDDDDDDNNNSKKMTTNDNKEYNIMESNADDSNVIKEEKRLLDDYQS